MAYTNPSGTPTFPIPPGPISTPQPAPKSNGTPASPEDALTGENRDAYQALKALFDGYGLGSLAPKILDYVQQGYGADTIAILLQRTDEYKKRFAGNEARRAAGLPVLSPSDYLQTETAYRQIMRNAGLPVGFYDQPNDFTDFISKDVSPTEMKSRVDVAAAATVNADSYTKTALAQMGISGPDITAYFLDPNRAVPLIQKSAAVAQLGAAALRNNLEFNQQRAENMYLQGVNQDQAIQGFGAIAGYLNDATKLASIYGEQYNQTTAEAEVFGQQGSAQNTRKRLASAERGQFSGAVGSARGGLAAAKTNT